MTDAKLIDLAVEIRHETANAWLVHDGHRDVWVPKSQCEVVYEHYDGDKGSEVIITLPEWLAKVKELI
jgi:hypothetical protein